MSKRSCNTGLDNRCRDNDGEIRQKRNDTLVGTLRRTYGTSFATGYRRAAKLGTVLKGENAATLSEFAEALSNVMRPDSGIWQHYGSDRLGSDW